MTALRIGELALEAGFPPGVLNVVPGFGKTAGEALVDHPDVDKITFTGSPGVGRQILQGAAGNLKRVTLELGGKSANIIFPDADSTRRSRPRLPASSSTAGQVCSAGSRILVARDDLRRGGRAAGRARRSRSARRSAAIRRPPWGRWSPTTQMKRVLDYIEIGQQEGARIVDRRRAAGDTGYFVEPTVFAGVEHDMRISQEEIFGPVAAVIQFNDDEDAIRIANGTGYSLAAGVWSATSAAVHRFARATEGRHRVGQHLRPDRHRLPWGGARDSGFGREHGDMRDRELHRAQGRLDQYRPLRGCERATTTRDS